MKRWQEEATSGISSRRSESVRPAPASTRESGAGYMS